MSTTTMPWDTDTRLLAAALKPDAGIPDPRERDVGGEPLPDCGDPTCGCASRAPWPADLDRKCSSCNKKRDDVRWGKCAECRDNEKEQAK